MSFHSLNSDLASKVLLLANLQKQIMQNQLVSSTNNTEVETTNHCSSKNVNRHPLLVPSLNVSAKKISEMLSAVTPSTVMNSTHSQSSLSTVSSSHSRSNGSSFGWGNRERKMEENWRLQHRKTSNE